MLYDMKASGSRIKLLRQQTGATQEKLSEELGISLSMLKQVEAGRKGVSIELLVLLASHFDVSLDYIILGKTTHKADIKPQLHDLICRLQALEDAL